MRNNSGDASLHQRMVAEVVPPYTGRHWRNTLWLTGFKHPFQRGTWNGYHDLSRGWDLNRRPPEQNPQASALDHSATRPHEKRRAATRRAFQRVVTSFWRAFVEFVSSYWRIVDEFVTSFRRFFEQLLTSLLRVVTRIWRAFGEFLTGFWRVLTSFDEFLMSFWRVIDVFDEFLTSFWRVFDEFVTSFWQFFDEFLMNFDEKNCRNNPGHDQ